MGVGYYREVVQWSKGEYPGANNQEDDLAIITTQNGFGYRVDDHGDSLTTASPLGVAGGTAVSDEGIIERTTDNDYFVFTTGTGPISLNIDPYYLSPNLDILATLYNESGTVIATSNPVDALNASFNIGLTAGTYYLSIDGTGRTAAGSDTGYSDYGSLGYYSITGTVNAPSAAPVGPRLFAVRPNDGDLLTRDAVTVLDVSPREMRFLFKGGSNLDPATLDGIRITRRGEDQEFDVASTRSDLGTGGRVVVEFTGEPAVGTAERHRSGPDGKRSRRGQRSGAHDLGGRQPDLRRHEPARGRPRRRPVRSWTRSIWTPSPAR